MLAAVDTLSLWFMFVAASNASLSAAPRGLVSVPLQLAPATPAPGSTVPLPFVLVALTQYVTTEPGSSQFNLDIIKLVGGPAQDFWATNSVADPAAYSYAAVAAGLPQAAGHWQPHGLASC